MYKFRTTLYFCLKQAFMSHKVFGKNPTGRRLQRVKQSPNYKDGSFENLSKTPVMAEDGSFWNTMKEYFKKDPARDPVKPLPFVKSDLRGLTGNATSIVWFGHSSYLLRTGGKNILVDPVFSKNASPVSFMVKAYKGTTEYDVADMPPLDLVVITHDHYDHLDYSTIRKLKTKTNKWLTALGVGSHLEEWGIHAGQITELDWWEESDLLPGMHFTATPARHFSGRSLRRGKTLWTSFVLQTDEIKIFLGGDSGYDKHFKKIGNLFGPFDMAILESGQYNKNWPHIHMMPEETVIAAVDLGAKVLLPVHWGKFTLSLHPWNEPVKRVLKKAEELNQEVTTPRIGEIFEIGKRLPQNHWWDEVS
jgi:L-ascorbate metabolism protein UlaG (beta-lactamase superfamily)